MTFGGVPVTGAFLVAPEPRRDERGAFARVWCREEFGDHDLATSFAQCNTSVNVRRGTLRGLHYQAAPDQEVKLVRCTRGAIFDVLVDVRPHSVTYRRWFGAELTAENGLMLYVPEGCAHGYVTLVDHSEVFYMVSRPYRAQAERGVRWDDPAFGIEWPVAEDLTISEKDRRWPDFVA